MQSARQPNVRQLQVNPTKPHGSHSMPKQVQPTGSSIRSKAGWMPCTASAPRQAAPAAGNPPRGRQRTNR
eukprot:15479163-Alexandrium_andersonii.AAC.1